ncbi:hypothetical protein HYZ97_01740 [Candidatus Pacearchaeota archaeon]|nr:hypothetical protein [Candidatus Pacearchaeota archaeon]
MHYRNYQEIAQNALGMSRFLDCLVSCAVKQQAAVRVKAEAFVQNLHDIAEACDMYGNKRGTTGCESKNRLYFDNPVVDIILRENLIRTSSLERDLLEVKVHLDQLEKVYGSILVKQKISEKRARELITFPLEVFYTYQNSRSPPIKDIDSPWFLEVAS